MVKTEILARFDDGVLTCSITTPEGHSIRLSGSSGTLEPDVEWPDGLDENRALVTNAWAFTTLKYRSLTGPSVREQEEAAKDSKQYHAATTWLAGLVGKKTWNVREGWCSGCFTKSNHRQLKELGARSPVWLCANCGGPSVPCAALGCPNMAVRLKGRARAPRYCAEHRHDIPGFQKAGKKLDHLSEYHHFLEYEKPNLAKLTRMTGGSFAVAGILGPLALTAAPAVGGAIGSLLGYSGIVATNAGLALLGGGSLAVGGLGMAGGTMVVTAVGAALGGVLGANVMSAYLRQDKSFHIEMLRGGEGVPVVVANGFLTESTKGWGEWKTLIETRYPNSPVYRVHWGSKELKDLGMFVGLGGGKHAGGAVLTSLAKHATKLAPRRLNPGMSAIAAADVAKNPWHVAKNRSEKTGVIIADLLARTREDSYVLVGHSLGARAMLTAAETMATASDTPRIEALHLLGAAVGSKRKWADDFLSDGTLYNYHSGQDAVLKNAYRGAELGKKAAGLNGFQPAADNVVNVDVSDTVGGHSGYFEEVELR